MGAIVEFTATNDAEVPWGGSDGAVGGILEASE